MPSEAFEAIVAAIGQSDALDLPLSERRAAVEEGARLVPPPEDVSFEEVEVGGLGAEWVAAPAAAPERTILYLHGGSYTICSPRTHRRLTAALSREARSRVLALDYRLAPEHPFPAAVEDAVSAYRWLLEGGAAPARIAVAGDSAGGGLTVAALVAARDDGLPLPAAAVAISPWADLELTGDSVVANADVDVMLSAGRLKESADLYLAGSDGRSPLASPIHADLTGLPPMLIHAAGREILLDDARRLADRARAAGVEATLEVWDEGVHVWHVFAGLAPEADESVRRVGQFLLAHLDR